MEGINPSLAFLALIVGISGNARDNAANDPTASIETERGTGCPTLMISGAPPQPANQQSWDAFWDSADSASVLPDVIEPEWADSAPAKIDASPPTGDLALPVLDDGSDPIARHPVPTGAGGPAADAKPDPCGPTP